MCTHTFWRCQKTYVELKIQDSLCLFLQPLFGCGGRDHSETCMTNGQYEQRDSWLGEKTLESSDT